MKPFKRSLSLVVILVISVGFAALSALFSYNQYVVLKQHAFNEAKLNLKTILMVSQARFDKEFRHRDETSVEREVMALNLLERDLDNYLLPDGGTIERSPGRQFQLLRDLVEIRTVLSGAMIDAPPAIGAAIGRLAPLVEMVRHDDGTLAQFESLNHLKKLRTLNISSTKLSTDSYERITRIFRLADVRY